MDVHSVAELVPERHPTRRDVIEATGAATLGGALSALSAEEAAAERLAPDAPGDPAVFEADRGQSASAFPQSVASGGPTPEGVLLWTRVAPDAYDGETPLGVEVAKDEEFENVAFQGTVPAEAFGPDRDFTVTVDVDGELDPDSRYYYRFRYDGSKSALGRCRTLPKPGASPDSLRLAVASCNNYLHGYFGAFGHIADDEADFLLHLGDFIYEYAGDGIGDRSIDLPSGKQKAWGLDDFRHLYRTYRSDENLRRALRTHTLIHTWDDHEIVSDRWWNYETDAPETEYHPRGSDPEFMRQLYVDGIRAYTEYVPVRAKYEPASENRGLAPDAIQENFRLYRSFAFGDLADLFVTDERLYRSPPPRGTESGTAVSAEFAAENPGRTMLGETQREWLVGGMTDSDARWKLWGNEVLAAAFRFVEGGEMQINSDAWDGYRAERQRVLSDLSEAGVENLVALTGDMHSYLAGYLLTEYELTAGEDGESGRATDRSDTRAGVEFMAPAVSSDNLMTMNEIPDSARETVSAALQAENPHVEWFDSSHWGYATVEMNREEVVYSAYAVDRTTDAEDPPKRLLRRYRVPAGSAELERSDQREE
ncbi:alkaline phosphatase D family protein [Halorussus lipolyticus]|uniref:alkaline phosphatase D family protein n=1 Tax=Halorussus lipolyticus TaxID=3034024 RepID=UPI0023E8F591|nr:alkaline phosphatase D family protein [Halorussus sp. DT80]